MYLLITLQSSRIAKQPETNGYISNFVEIHDDQRGWGFLCFESIDLKIANVICRETSHSFAFRVRKGDHPDFTRTRYNMTLNCTGEESNLRECKRNLTPVRKCRDKETILECRTGEYCILSLIINVDTISRCTQRVKGKSQQ